MIPIIASLLPVLTSVLDKVIPNVAAREAAKAEIALKLAENENELLKLLTEVDKGQLEINKMEAQSAHFFVAGWRPAIGWICASALSWMYLLQPAIQSILFWLGKATAPGQLDTMGILGLTASLLGFGGLRTWESLKGVERSNLKEF